MEAVSLVFDKRGSTVFETSYYNYVSMELEGAWINQRKFLNMKFKFWNVDL